MLVLGPPHDGVRTSPLAASAVWRSGSAFPRPWPWSLGTSGTAPT